MPDWKYTVVCPALNEAKNLPLLIERIDQAMGDDAVQTDVLIVDDGSTDDSLAVLRPLVEAKPNVTVVVFEGNHGQTKALQAGFDHARGERIVTIDSDLQMDPADIPRLIEKLEADGLDLVYLKKRYEGAPWIRRVSSRVANGFRRAITKDTAKDVGSNYKVYRTNFFKGRNFGSGLHRFFTGFAEVEGYKLGWIEGAVAPRTAGFSNYTVLGRLRQGLPDMFYYALYRLPKTTVPRWLYGLFFAALVVALLPIGSGWKLALWAVIGFLFTTTLALLAHALHLTVMRSRTPYVVREVWRDGVIPSA